MLTSLTLGLYKRGERRAHLKCKGKDVSESDKLTKVLEAVNVITHCNESFCNALGTGLYIQCGSVHSEQQKCSQKSDQMLRHVGRLT